MSGIQPGQEGGYTAPDGTSWYHAPWEGWQRAEHGMGRFLDAILNPEPQPGPPYVHTVDLGEPEAVITKLGWFIYEVDIHHGITTFGAPWLCLGKRHAESKGRRELRKYRRVPYSYTLTS